PPVMTPMIGVTMSVTSELTIAPNAAPMMIPTAISTTFPFIANSLNSLNMIGPSEVKKDTGNHCGQDVGGTIHRRATGQDCRTEFEPKRGAVQAARRVAFQRVPQSTADIPGVSVLDERMPVVKLS